MTTNTAPPDLDEAGLPHVSRLARADVREAAAVLGPEQVRYHVDLYYQVQELRKATANRVRSAGDEEPASVADWTYRQFETTESVIRALLDEYTSRVPVGEWAKSQYGIGPVITAGLLAHIDIDRAPTPGHIYRLAGLDPGMVWRDRDRVRREVTAAWEESEGAVAALLRLAGEYDRRVLALYEQVADVTLSTDDVLAVLRALRPARDDVERVWREALVAAVHPDRAIVAACEALDLDPDAVYGDLLSEALITRDGLQGVLGKRPWNGKLKTLCWKVGDSFVKFSGSDRCFYGRLYRERKAYEVARNERGDLAEQAAQALATRTFRDAATRKVYEAGRLPDGRIDLRARRWAVKLFLSHFHEVWSDSLGREVPVPYAIAHLGHRDKIAPPGWPMPGD